MSNIRTNALSLTILQIANFATPLLTLPYLTRTLGLEVFGLNVMVQAILQYFILFTGWGFSLSATKKLAVLKNNKEKINEIYSATWAAQWLLLLISILIIVASTHLFSSLERNSALYYWGLANVLGSVLLPVWLLQGLEKMAIIATVQVISRIAALPFYFFIIKGPQDADIAIALNGLTSIAAGLFSLWWINHKNIAKLTLPPAKQVFHELGDGFLVFASLTWTSLYTYLTPIALGAISGPAALGVFNLADKFRQAGTALLSPLSQALFPRMSYLFETDRFNAIKLVKKSAAFLISIASIGSCLLYFGAELIINSFGGTGFEDSKVILKELSIIPVIVILSNILGIQILLPSNNKKQYSAVYGLAGIVSICIMIPLIQKYGPHGATLNIIITELIVTISMAIIVTKRKLLY